MKLIGKWIDDIFEKEVPTGAVNGSNVTFILSATPHSNKAVRVTLNGLSKVEGTHYSLSGSTITFTSAPVTGQTVYSEYVKK